MEERVLKILGEQCEEALDYDGDDMLEDGVMDSFAVMEIVGGLEAEFDIEIDASYVIAKNFKNKNAIIALVRKVLMEKGK